jgi:hypothetical protein
MSAPISAAGTPPTPPTCPKRISGTSSGRPRASSPGPAPSARRPRPSSRPSSRTDRTEQGYRSCSASCGWPNATATPGSRPRVLAPWPSARAPTGMSTRSSNTASTGSWGPQPPRRSCPHPRIRGPAYYHDPDAAGPAALPATSLVLRMSRYGATGTIACESAPALPRPTVPHPTHWGRAKRPPIHVKEEPCSTPQPRTLRPSKLADGRRLDGNNAGRDDRPRV